MLLLKWLPAGAGCDTRASDSGAAAASGLSVCTGDCGWDSTLQRSEVRRGRRDTASCKKLTTYCSDSGGEKSSMY